MMNQVRYSDALHMMELHGGSFVRALAECHLRADAANRQRLRGAFPEYFERYEKLYREWLAAHPEAGKGSA